MVSYGSEWDWIGAAYEQYQREEERAKLARVPTPEEDDHARAECEKMAEKAAFDDNYQAKCLYGEKVFYYDYPKALVPGHIYSHAGKDEFGISRCCEYHFDEMFGNDDEEETAEWYDTHDAITGENLVWDSVWREG